MADIPTAVFSTAGRRPGLILMLDTAKELSDLSQQIALSATSADLVEQELKKCRREERDNRWQDAREGRTRKNIS